ncbi:hypothetical protein GALMADRAFT_249346 [Galerina marginata CBS 339.88]|uniref:BTB domain-containing protein n=1 Tax=Galerina marginata (strain CBS 339.88) TaxID=685588 RepID=A0A067T5W4_GALM3|nr:hypothetical protein GALMADRAFT_249346 [Galerina marginata CBS 339.88]
MQLEADENFIRPTSSPITSLKYHPDFSSPDGNVILAAKDAKMYFRVHSHTLRTTSGFFRTMYSLPQSTATPDIMYLDEDADVLEHVLRMVCGLPFAEISSHDFFDSLLYAAEKYDMPGPMSLMRMYLLMPTLAGNPIRLYAVARRYEWQQEAKLLSTRTLSLNLYDKNHHTSLRTLSTDALLDLFLLHRARREGLRECLDGPPFVSGDPSRCIQCETPIEYTTWRELKHRIVTEMDERPLGDNILDMGLCMWPEAVACWKAACSNETCKRLLYDRAETVKVIRECVEQLPKTYK